MHEYNKQTYDEREQILPCNVGCFFFYLFTYFVFFINNVALTFDVSLEEKREKKDKQSSSNLS